MPELPGASTEVPRLQEQFVTVRQRSPALRQRCHQRVVTCNELQDLIGTARRKVAASRKAAFNFTATVKATLVQIQAGVVAFAKMSTGGRSLSVKSNHHAAYSLPTSRMPAPLMPLSPSSDRISSARAERRRTTSECLSATSVVSPMSASRSNNARPILAC